MNLQEKKNGKVLTIFLQKVAICWLGKMLVRMLEGTKHLENICFQLQALRVEVP